MSEHPQTHIRSVPQAVGLWLDICEKIGRDGRETVEPETLKEYKRRGNVMMEYLWSKDIRELETADIVHFRNWLLENKSRDLARRTLSSFHSMIIEMKHQGHIKDDPAAGISIKSTGRYETDDAEVQIPADTEMQAILQAADRMGDKNSYMAERWARYRPMIYLACLTGMRPSEYRGLSWKDVFEDRVEIKQRADKTGIIGPVKSRAGRRTIYLPRFVTDMIFEWENSAPKSDYGLVFPTATGRPQALTNIVAGAWIPLMKEAGLMVEKVNGDKMVLRPKYTPYTLRHYYASKLIEKGNDLKFIQQTMGHSKIEVTLNVYGHLLKGREESYKAAAEELAAELLKNTCGESVASPL